MIRNDKATTLIISAILVSLAGIFLAFRNTAFEKADPVHGEYPSNGEEMTIEEEIVEIGESEEAVNVVPDIVKGVYVTGWAAGSRTYNEYLFDLIDNTEINSVIIDVKDYSGYVSYMSEVDEVIRYGARQRRIADVRGLIDELHERDIYVIARITIFQDPILSVARPDLAIKSKARIAAGSFGSAAIWRDRSGLGWVDPSSKEAWDYNIAISKEALDLGFDELNFDYIRFPSDGSLSDMSFPFWDGRKRRRDVIREFYEYLREELPDAVLSADLFGLTTVNYDDLGIGQVIEDAYPYFDYVAPMVYPSHYARGFLGFQNPAEHPYEVVRYSIATAVARLRIDGSDSKLRPWLQDFSLGAVYGENMVRAQINATIDGAGEDYAGYMLWNARSRYTKEALR